MNRSGFRGFRVLRLRVLGFGFMYRFGGFRVWICSVRFYSNLLVLKVEWRKECKTTFWDDVGTVAGIHSPTPPSAPVHMGVSENWGCLILGSL